MSETTASDVSTQDPYQTEENFQVNRANGTNTQPNLIHVAPNQIKKMSSGYRNGGYPTMPGITQPIYPVNQGNSYPYNQIENSNSQHIQFLSNSGNMQNGDYGHVNPGSPVYYQVHHPYHAQHGQHMHAHQHHNLQQRQQVMVHASPKMPFREQEQHKQPRNINENSEEVMDMNEFQDGQGQEEQGSEYEEDSSYSPDNTRHMLMSSGRLVPGMVHGDGNQNSFNMNMHSPGGMYFHEKHSSGEMNYNTPDNSMTQSGTYMSDDFHMGRGTEMTGLLKVAHQGDHSMSMIAAEMIIAVSDRIESGLARINESVKSLSLQSSCQQEDCKDNDISKKSSLEKERTLSSSAKEMKEDGDNTKEKKSYSEIVQANPDDHHEVVDRVSELAEKLTKAENNNVFNISYVQRPVVHTKKLVYDGERYSCEVDPLVFGGYRLYADTNMSFNSKRDNYVVHAGKFFVLRITTFVELPADCYFNIGPHPEVVHDMQDKGVSVMQTCMSPNSNGSVLVKIRNEGEKKYYINPGDLVAIAYITRKTNADLVELDDDGFTERVALSQNKYTSNQCFQALESNGDEIVIHSTGGEETNESDNVLELHGKGIEHVVSSYYNKEDAGVTEENHSEKSSSGKQEGCVDGFEEGYVVVQSRKTTKKKSKPVSSNVHHKHVIKATKKTKRKTVEKHHAEY